MELIWIMGFFFIFITFAFITVAFFFPEWLGITGKKAQDVISSHNDDSNNSPSV